MFGLRIIIEAVFGQVDDDSFARSGRQDMPARDDDLFAGAGQPWIHIGIDANEFLGAQAVRSRKIVEGVLVDGFDTLVLTNHGIGGARNDILRGVHPSCAAQRQ